MSTCDPLAEEWRCYVAEMPDDELDASLTELARRRAGDRDVIKKLQAEKQRRNLKTWARLGTPEWYDLSDKYGEIL